MGFVKSMFGKLRGIRYNAPFLSGNWPNFSTKLWVKHWIFIWGFLHCTYSAFSDFVVHWFSAVRTCVVYLTRPFYSSQYLKNNSISRQIWIFSFHFQAFTFNLVFHEFALIFLSNHFFREPQIEDRRKPVIADLMKFCFLGKYLKH